MMYADNLPHLQHMEPRQRCIVVGGILYGSGRRVWLANHIQRATIEREPITLFGLRLGSGHKVTFEDIYETRERAWKDIETSFKHGEVTAPLSSELQEVVLDQFKAVFCERGRFWEFEGTIFSDGKWRV